MLCSLIVVADNAACKPGAVGNVENHACVYYCCVLFYKEMAIIYII